MVSTALLSASSQPCRLIRTASIRSCPGFRAQLLRCMSQQNDGLIQVIRLNENGATKPPARSAASAIADEYAW